MRTTLTIDDDLAALLKQRAPEFGLPFKQVVNQALRVGLGAQAKPRARTVPRTIPQAFAVPGRNSILTSSINSFDELEVGADFARFPGLRLINPCKP